MFSSTSFPDLPPSLNGFLPPNLLFENENDCCCFDYCDPFISDGCFYHSSSLIMENVSKIKQDFVSQQQHFSAGRVLESGEDHCGLLEAVVSCCNSGKKTMESKKDGHGKICTAQGLRDRRVRLSIEISQKFFCLQDLLGFDKASKTLDWLLTKSKNAIKELVNERSHCSSFTVTDQSKADFLESIKGDVDDDKGKKKRFDGKRKKMTRRSIAGFQENLARDESRAMARARARKRTREKMNL
ncbi:hypothetical protein R6Q59_034833 [Mikania micrantha]